MGLAEEVLVRGKATGANGGDSACGEYIFPSWGARKGVADVGSPEERYKGKRGLGEKEALGRALKSVI